MARLNYPIPGYAGEVRVGNSEEDKVILGWCKEHSTAFNGEVLDTTNYQDKGWMSNITGLRSWELSISTLYVDADPGLNKIRSAYFSVFPQVIHVPNLYFELFVLGQGAAPIGSTYLTGMCSIESIEYSDAVDDLVTVSLSLKGSGPCVPKLTTTAPPAITP